MSSKIWDNTLTAMAAAAHFPLVSAQALTKVGLDGAWVGANQGSSYFFFATTSGEHHLCVTGNRAWRRVRGRLLWPISRLKKETGITSGNGLFPGKATNHFTS